MRLILESHSMVKCFDEPQCYEILKNHTELLKSNQKEKFLCFKAPLFTEQMDEPFFSDVTLDFIINNHYQNFPQIFMVRDVRDTISSMMTLKQEKSTWYDLWPKKSLEFWIATIPGFEKRFAKDIRKIKDKKGELKKIKIYQSKLSQNKENEDEFGKTETSIKNLHYELKNLEDELEKSEKAVEGLNVEIQNKKTDLTKSKDFNTKLSQEIQEKDSELIKSKDFNTKLSQEIQEKDSELIKSKDFNTKLSQEIQEKDSELTKSKDPVEEFNIDLKNLEDELEKSEKAVEGLKREIQDVEDDITNTKKFISKLNEEFLNRKKNLQTLSKNERISFIKSESNRWVKMVEILTKIFEIHSKKHILFIKFEELKKNTLETLEEIFNFVDIDVDNNQFKKIIYELKNEFDENPLDNWNNKFNDEEKKIMNEIMGKYLKNYGYFIEKNP